jgi:NAD(P)-dependent dehydrogenase (short-subunit alcohol dehydrogenase family)
MLPLDSSSSPSLPTVAMSRKVVVVLGGNGYLGQRIVNSVLRKGANVLCVSRSGKAPPHYVLPANLPGDVQVTWHKGTRRIIF